MTELKPCPWCGEQPNTDDGRFSDVGPRVWCDNFSGCLVQPVAEGPLIGDAIAAWNTRALDPQAASLADEVRAIAEDGNFSNEMVGIAVRNWFHRAALATTQKGLKG